jgi:protoheme IX farnesyltransferase
MDSTPRSLSPEALYASPWTAYKELTKPRLSLMSVLTAIGGYWMARPLPSMEVFLSLSVGTLLAAGGASALNQYLERDLDALMERTQKRPLPQSALMPLQACAFGLFLSVLGVGLLAMGVNSIAAILTALTVLSYAFIYTPLKRKTPFCTHLGTIPGALPILVGWSAANGSVDALGWVLFSILAVWQMPHFMAIAWLYRKDYARAGMPMASVIDPSGRRAGREGVVFSVLLVGLSIWPWVMGDCTAFYGVGLLAVSLWMLWRSILFLKNPNGEGLAKKMFWASIIYLPIFLSLGVIDRLVF